MKIRKFIAYCCLTTIFILAVCIASTCVAETQAETQINDAALFFLGYSAGFLTHEYGHQTLANSYNINMEWQIAFPNYFSSHWIAYGGNDKELRQIAKGGFYGQILTTEILMGLPKEKRDAFWWGMISFNITNAIGYIAQHEIQRHQGGYGDFKTIKRTGGNDKLLEIALLMHTAFTVYRIITDSEPFFEVKIESNPVAKIDKIINQNTAPQRIVIMLPILKW